MSLWTALAAASSPGHFEDVGTLVEAASQGVGAQPSAIVALAAVVAYDAAPACQCSVIQAGSKKCRGSHGVPRMQAGRCRSATAGK